MFVLLYGERTNYIQKVTDNDFGIVSTLQM